MDLWFFYCKNVNNIGNNQDNIGKNPHVDTYVNPHDDKEAKVLEYCIELRSKKEITEYLGYRTVKSVTPIIKSLIEAGKLIMEIPEKPKSRNQKYITVKSQKRYQIRYPL